MIPPILIEKSMFMIAIVAAAKYDLHEDMEFPNPGRVARTRTGTSEDA
jgi:hypothetical protein